MNGTIMRDTCTAVYIYRFVCPFLTEIVNIYLKDKTYHKLTSDIIPQANYLHEIKELSSKELSAIIT